MQNTDREWVVLYGDKFTGLDHARTLKVVLGVKYTYPVTYEEAVNIVHKALIEDGQHSANFQYLLRNINTKTIVPYDIL